MPEAEENVAVSRWVVLVVARPGVAEADKEREQWSFSFDEAAPWYDCK